MSRALYWQLAGFYFFYFGYIGAFAPYFSLYLASLGHTAALIGALMALPQAMRIFAPHLWGYLSDRHDSRVRIVCLAGLGGTLCFAGVFAAGGPLWLAACIALWSFFWSAALPLVETTTLDHLGERSGDYGRIRLWGSIGFIVAVIGVGWLLDRAPIDVLLWIVLTTMVGTLATIWRVPERAHDRHAAPQEPLVQVLKRPEVMALIAACFLMAVAHGPYYTFFSLHLVDHGYSKTAIGWLWAIGVIAEIAVFAWLPALYRNFSAFAMLLASLALAVVRFGLIAWLVESIAMLVIAQLLHAATFGVFHSAALASIHRLFRGANQARGQAAYSSLSFGLGGTLGGLGSGWVWQPWGPAATFTAASLCALAGFALLFAVGPRGR